MKHITPSLLFAFSSLAFAWQDPDYAAIASYKRGDSRAAMRVVEENIRVGKAGSQEIKNMEENLANLLSGESTYDGKLFACKMLWIIGSESSLEKIGQLLSDEKTADIACFALATQASEKAVPLLLDALPKAKGRAKIAIVNLLGEKRDARAVGALSGITGANWSFAVSALGKIGTRDAVTALASMRKKDGIDLSILDAALLQAAQEMGKRGKHGECVTLCRDLLAQAAVQHIKRGALSVMATADPKAAAKEINAILAKPGTPLRPTAISLARTLPEPLVRSTLLARMSSLPATEQVDLLIALEEREGTAFVDALHNALNHKDPNVRLAAIGGLAKEGNADSVNRLVALMLKAATEESAAARQSLVTSVHKDANKAMLDCLDKTSGTDRSRLIVILTDRRAKGSVSKLVKLCSGQDKETMTASFRALGVMGNCQAVGLMVRALSQLESSEVRNEAERAIGTAAKRTKHTVPITSAWKKETAPEKRASLLRTMGYAPDENTFGEVAGAVADTDHAVRDAAVRTLAGWPNTEALPPLLTVLGSTSNDTHRVLALRGAVRLAESAKGEKTNLFKKIVPHVKSDADARLVLGAVGKLSDPEALKLVEEVRRDGVKAEADRAVAEIKKTLKK